MYAIVCECVEALIEVQIGLHTMYRNQKHTEFGFICLQNVPMDPPFEVDFLLFELRNY